MITKNRLSPTITMFHDNREVLETHDSNNMDLVVPTRSPWGIRVPIYIDV